MSDKAIEACAAAAAAVIYWVVLIWVIQLCWNVAMVAVFGLPPIDVRTAAALWGVGWLVRR